MKSALAGRLFLLLNQDESINYPMSLFLNERFDNANTRELVAQSLRLFERFLRAFNIELEARAVEGECLSSHECSRLADLAWRPLAEVELMSDSMLKRITSAASGVAPKGRPKAVEPSTVKKRLDHIALFLGWYLEAVLDESIRSAATRLQLRERYQAAQSRLKHEVRGTKQNHHHQIKSLPSEKFKRIIRELVLYPERLFVTAKGRKSSTVLRDRAIALLACEGLRPGAISNVTLKDFRSPSEGTVGYLDIKDNLALRRRPITSGTPHQKGMTSTSVSYASETTITLWPFTCTAIREYITKERAAVLRRFMRNGSHSFLFLNEKTGGPIGHRSTVTAVFNRLGGRLKVLGLLDVSNDPHATGEIYDFYAYVLRHSSASLFLETNLDDPAALDKMKTRYAWSHRSQMPQRYANRALSEAASFDMMDFHQSLLNATRSREGA